MSYFTNIAVQNVNKGFVYITDLTWSLSSDLLVRDFISNLSIRTREDFKCSQFDQITRFEIEIVFK